MTFPAFLDACVLVPIALTDTLLRLAEADTYRPLWSDDVLGEVLLDQLDLYPRATLQCMREQIAAYNNPTMSITEFLKHFSRTVPKFADAAGSLLLGNQEQTD
jgi:hypothetical protein